MAARLVLPGALLVKAGRVIVTAGSDVAGDLSVSGDLNVGGAGDVAGALDAGALSEGGAAALTLAHYASEEISENRAARRT